MASSPRQQLPLSIEEIRGQYFAGAHHVGRAKPSPVRRASADNIQPAPASNELTPSAKHIALEARKKLGQRGAKSGGLQEADSSFEAPTRLSPDENELFELIESIEDAEGEELSERERTAVVAALSASLEDYDVLTPLVQNLEVNDIIIRSYNDISIQSGKRNVQTDLRFPDHGAYKSFIENLLKRVGKACTVATPVVDAAIEPHVRACVTHESFSPPGSGPMLTLRISRHRNISLEALVQFELAPQTILDYLSVLVRNGHCTMLIGGEVGTGKTTLVKALAGCIPADEAILIIEDTHELVLHRPFVRTLLTREANTEGAGRISPANAIRTGMRLAMNRIILGEMRDSEAAEAFIDVCASGHSGLSTIHARSARDTLSRLELFLTRAQGNIGVESIRREIANAVAVVLYLGLDERTGKRRLLEVIEVGTSSDGVVQVSPMFTYLPDGEIPSWERSGGISQFSDLLKQSGMELPFPGDIVTLDPELMYRNLLGGAEQRRA